MGRGVGGMARCGSLPITRQPPPLSLPCSCSTCSPLSCSRQRPPLSDACPRARLPHKVTDGSAPPLRSCRTSDLAPLLTARLPLVQRSCRLTSQSPSGLSVARAVPRLRTRRRSCSPGCCAVRFGIRPFGCSVRRPRCSPPSLSRNRSPPPPRRRRRGLVEGLSADELVGEALFREVYALDRERNDLLTRPAKSPQHAPALWHAGYVNWNRRWLSPEDVARATATSGHLAAYIQRRDDAPDTLAGHLALANWCRDHKLPERKRTHLTRVLQFDVNHADARRRLGFREVDGMWLSAEELAAAQRDARACAAGLAQWGPRVESLAAALDDRAAARRPGPHRALGDQRPGGRAGRRTVPFAAAGGARFAVDMLAAMPGKNAAVALARLAVFSTYPDVAAAAAQALAPATA